jgi:hypothetical protein
VLFSFALYRVIRSNDELVSVGGLRKARLALSSAHDLTSPRGER